MVDDVGLENAEREGEESGRASAAPGPEAASGQAAPGIRLRCSAMSPPLVQPRGCCPATVRSTKGGIKDRVSEGNMCMYGLHGVKRIGAQRGACELHLASTSASDHSQVLVAPSSRAVS